MLLLLLFLDEIKKFVWELINTFSVDIPVTFRFSYRDIAMTKIFFLQIAATKNMKKNANWHLLLFCRWIKIMDIVIATIHQTMSLKEKRFAIVIEITVMSNVHNGILFSLCSYDAGSKRMKNIKPFSIQDHLLYFEFSNTRCINKINKLL